MEPLWKVSWVGRRFAQEVGAMEEVEDSGEESVHDGLDGRDFFFRDA